MYKANEPAWTGFLGACRSLEPGEGSLEPRGGPVEPGEWSMEPGEGPVEPGWGSRGMYYVINNFFTMTYLL